MINIQSLNRQENLINQAILSIFRENGIYIATGLLSLTTAFLILYNFEIFVYLVTYIIKVLISIITSIIYYYSIVVLRYFGAFFNGVGYDISESYCKLPYKFVNVYNSYIKLYKLSNISNISNIYDTEGYYNYCIQDTQTALATFIWAHLFYIICIVINASFIHFSEIHIYPLYKMMISRVNNNNSNNNQYEMVSQNEESRQRMNPFELKQFVELISTFTGFTYAIIAVINFLIRKSLPYNSVSIFHQYIFLFSGLVLCQFISLIYLVKNTPFTEELELENV